MSALTERFDAVCERLAAAVARAGKAPCSVRLVAVSKWHGAEAVAALAAHWHSLTVSGAPSFVPQGPAFGESYVQEAILKMEEVGNLLASANLSGQSSGNLSGISADTSLRANVLPQWHFIGHLQSRKAKEVAGQYALIHSVDSLKVAQHLHKAWESVRDFDVAASLEAVEGSPHGGKSPQDILLQVNIGREPQKSGVMPEDLESLLLACVALPGLCVRGLMCLPPDLEDAEAARPFFTALRVLRDAAQSASGIQLPELSMGMSHDFEAAIAEGATCVRIGTDIFGVREY